MAVEIFNTDSNTLLSGTSGKDYISNGDAAMGGDEDIDGGSNVTIDARAGDDEIFNCNGNYVSISGGKGNDTIENGYDVIGNEEGEYYVRRSGGDYVTISGGNGKDYIYSDGSYVSVSGGVGNDTIKSYLGRNMTINGGKGNDYVNLYDYYYEEDEEGYGEDEPTVLEAKNVVIQYAKGDGNDVIYGFNSTDTLQITEGSYTMVQSGSDLIVKVGKGTITLKYVSSANIDGELILPTGLTFNADKTKITASKKFAEESFSIVQYPEVQIFDGQKVTHNLEITGNSLDNTIEGGKKTDTIYGGEGDDKIFGNGGNDILYGDAGNDTLYGGGGDDTLTGGDGNDVFSYSSGDDVITDYTAGSDYIRLYKCSITGSSVKGKNVILETTTGNITIKNGKGKEISVLTTQVYGSSSSTLFEENDFVMADNLSGIVENNFTATAFEKISVANFENLSQENLLIYTEN